MKRKLVALLIGVAASAGAVLSSNAQGYITLDNYTTSGPLITYNGTPIDNSFTVGLYYALNDVVSSVPADASGIGIPGGPLVLGTGAGATAPGVGGGYFVQPLAFAVPGSTAGQIVTLEMIAYNGSDYASSLVRGHSTPFTITALANTAIPPALVGNAMPTFSVALIPEPATFALVGLGAAMLLIRRRK